MSERIIEENWKAFFSKHGVGTEEELIERRSEDPDGYQQTNDQFTAEYWINLNSLQRGKTVKEHIRAVVESRIHD